MRWRVAVAVVALMLGACQSEPDFDERYEAARKEVSETARRIDRDLEEREKEAVQAGNTLAPSASPVPDN